MAKSYSQKQLNRIEKGFCFYCGGDKQGSETLSCFDCRDKNKVYLNLLHKKKKAQGICLSCGNHVEGELTNCKKCQGKHTAKAKKQQQRRIANGQCARCHKEAVAEGKYPLCEDCWFRSMARRRTSINWQDIKQLMYQQEHKCVYTGKILVIGENASLDHKIPTSRGGSHSLENLQWVDYKINVMKNDFTHDEFLKVLKTILNYYDKEEK